MHLKGGNTFLLGGIITLCAAPAITLNVWPRIETILTSGLTSNEAGIVLLVTLSALGMTAVPFAMAKSPNRAFWWTTLSFGLGLATLNYIMAVGAIGKISDHATASAVQAISKAQSLKDQLEDLRRARRELGAVKPTTAEQVEAANEAVRLAEIAREQECTKVGDFCRARVAQLQSRLSERAEIVAARALAERAAGLDSQIIRAQTTLTNAGAVPLHANPQAERIKSIVQWFAPGVATEAVANGIIHFLAICAELFALGMPRILATALIGAPGRAEIAGGLPPPEKLNSVLRSGKAPPRQLAARPAIPPPRPAPATAEALAEWKRDHLKPSPGGRLKCWDVFKSYEKWAKARNLVPLSFTAFDFELTAVMQVKKETGSMSFYLDVSMSPKLKVVA